MGSESKHTPGPWRAIVSEPCRGDPFGDAMVNTPNATSAICCHKSGATLAEDRANAVLVAAAPDLLHELGAIADALRAGETVTIEPGSVRAGAILAVVAKAEGGAK